MLLKSEIIHNDIEQARVMLEKFANDFEKLHGEESITMNIHIVRHLADSVIQCGPLWSYSMFAFEKNLGNLKKSVMNGTDALDTISFHYCLKQKSTPTCSNEIQITSKSRINDTKITPSEKNILIECLPNDKFEFGHACKIKKEIYKSTKSPVTKSIDHFIQMKNSEDIGSATLYVNNNGKIYVLVKLYEIIEKHQHLIRIKATEQYKVFAASQIESKLIYMKFGSFEIVAKEPNVFENTS